MAASTKISATHLSRQAVVYLRQSSARQVQRNQESAINQRALATRLLELGWPEGQIHVIDEDQAMSAAQAEGRDGFRKLAADVGLRKVGIIMGYEVSRLSRNCADWHQLLELCGVFGTLIADVDGVYDPREFNDRLLLGLKGTMSEAELHSIRLRLDAGRLSKARRGELEHHLPTGLVRRDDGVVTLDPDISVVNRIRLVFERFTELQSIHKVLAHFGRHGLLLPRRQCSGIYSGQILWKDATAASLAQILKNPAYAGAFAYGRRIQDRSRAIPGRRSTGRVRQPPGAWLALVHDVYPALIGWDQHLEIQRQIAENTQRMRELMTRKRATRSGAAMLTGVVRCGRCGGAMYVRYRGDDGRHQYHCRKVSGHFHRSTCQSVSGEAVDKIVVEEFLTVLRSATIDALEEAERRQAENHGELVAQLATDVQRLEHAAIRAQRQYDNVDPENRLIAATLERQWEHALRDLQQARQRLADAERERPQAPPIAPELRDAFADADVQLPRLWPGLELEARKQLLRTMVAAVNLLRLDDGALQIRVVWRGGAVTERTIRVRTLSLRGSNAEKALADRMRELYAEGADDTEIVERLNAEGFKPCRADAFTLQVVRKTRARYGLRSNPTVARTEGVPGALTIRGMCELLSVNPSWFYNRIKTGELAISRDPRYHVYLFPQDPSLVEQLERLKRGETLIITVPEVQHNG